MSVVIWTSPQFFGFALSSSNKEPLSGALDGNGQVVRVALDRVTGAGAMTFDVKLFHGNTVETAFEEVFNESISITDADDSGSFDFVVAPYAPDQLTGLFAFVEATTAVGAWNVQMRIFAEPQA